MSELTIDPEFESLLPEPNESELAELKASIEANENVCFDTIKTWNGTIVDGHNRWKLCEQHGYQCYTEPLTFGSRTEVKEWIIRNQLARRNLSDYERTRLALLLKDGFAKEAEQRMKSGKADPVKNSAQGQKTRDKIADAAGVSHDTVRKVEEIEASDNEEIKQAAKSGDISINAAHKAVSGKSFVEDREGNLVPPEISEAYSKGVDACKEMTSGVNALIRQLAEFAETDAAKSMLSQLSKHGKKADEIKWTSTDLQNFKSLVETHRPHAVCPYCQGDGCKHCRGCGFVPKAVWESASQKRKEQLKRVAKSISSRL